MAPHCTGGISNLHGADLLEAVRDVVGRLHGG